MFDILKDELVGLMIRLSGEYRDGIPAVRLSQSNMKIFYNLCKEHELEGVVASLILEDGLCELPEYWKEDYLKEKERIEYFKTKTEQICTEMKKNGIPMIILKNGGIMTDIISDTAACPMEDIDSFIQKDNFLKAHEILLDNGFEFKFRSEFEKENLQEAFLDGSTEYFMPMPDGGNMWFELSHRAIAGRWIRPDKEPDTDELFRRFYYADNTDIGILSPEDNLLQVCIHTAKHSYVRSPGLRLHLDVERIVRHKQIDWKIFLERVEQAHVTTSTYYSLLIPSVLFHTPIPEDVLLALMPPKGKRKRIEHLLAHAGLLHPQSAKFTKVQFLFFQTSLYDSIGDVWKVIFPSTQWYRERYAMKSIVQLPYMIMIRVLDLIGIRKRK